MAKAWVACVFNGPKKEIGWYQMWLTDQGIKDPLLKSFPEDFFVCQWHGDTFHLPKEVVRFVSSDEYFNQVIRIKTMSYGFQFHFEITKEMTAGLLETGREEIEEMGDEDFFKKDSAGV